MRERKGSIKVKDGKFYAVVRWTDHNGQKRETMRRAQTRTDAKRLIKELLAALEQRGEAGVRPDCRTFADLANWFESNDVIPAQYSGGRKIAGRRAVEDVRLILKFQREYFSTRDLRSISWADLDKYRRDRLVTPTRQGRERSIAAVNRELAVLRKMFGIAAREGWILSNPFLTGKGLIDTASERKRDRVLSADEERQLLAGCKAAEARNDYIYLLTLFGIDTGMRQGEIMALQWVDVDLQNGRVTVRALNTKTLRERTLQLSRRVLIELQARRARLVATDAEATRERIFENLKDFPKDGFNNAVKRAGLTDFRFHQSHHSTANAAAFDAAHTNQKNGQAKNRSAKNRKSQSTSKNSSVRYQRKIQRIQRKIITASLPLTIRNRQTALPRRTCPCRTAQRIIPLVGLRRSTGLFGKFPLCPFLPIPEPSGRDSFD